jgi:hypothetical protein
MTTYLVTRKSDSQPVYRYSTDGGPIEWVGMEFATHDHTVYVEPPAPPPPPPPPVWITRRAFRNRFTANENITLELAAIDNPSAPMEQRAMSAMLRANQRIVSDGMYVDLTLAQTREGVQQLEQAGLIAVGRSVVILDTPPTDEEVYRG